MNPTYLMWQAERYQPSLRRPQAHACYPSATRARIEDENAAAMTATYRGLRAAARELGRWPRLARAKATEHRPRGRAGAACPEA
jgi:hypothetical protein